MPAFLNWAGYVESLHVIAAIQKHSATLQSSLFDLVAVYDPIIAIAVFVALFLYLKYLC